MARPTAWIGHFVGVMALVLCASLLPLPVRAQEGARFDDPDGRFTFTAPAGFDARASSSPAVVVSYISPALENANFSIAVRPFPSDITRDLAPQDVHDIVVRLYVRELRDLYRTIEIEETSIRPASLGGEEGREYDYFLTVSGLRLHGAQILLVRGDALYIVTFTATEDNYAALRAQTEAVFASFTFT